MTQANVVLFDVRVGFRRSSNSNCARRKSPSLSGRAFLLMRIYFGMTSRARWLATTSRISLRLRAASKADSRDP